MANVICDMENCIHRSNKSMRKYVMKNGEKCYKCALDLIVMRDEAELEIYELIGKSLPCCNRYEERKEI